VIVHAYPPTLVAFAASAVPLRPVFHMIRQASGMTDVLINDSARGRALAQALGTKTAVLMRGHGVVVAGASLPRAVGRSAYLEQSARIQAQAIGLGGEVTYLDPARQRRC
jgi:ribulose-5-phosphate 4-epimerase/fuculose-1-phosphate aldolase